MQRLTQFLGFGAFLASCLNLAALSPALAGSTGAGGISGANFTGTSNVPAGGPSFQGLPRAASPDVIVAPDGDLSFSPDAQARVSSAASETLASFSTGSPSQQAVAALISAAPGTAEAATAAGSLRNSLVAAGAPAAGVDALMAALEGLVDPANNQVDADKLESAIEAYNGLVGSPPVRDLAANEAFVAVNQALSRLRAAI